MTGDQEETKKNRMKGAGRGSDDVCADCAAAAPTVNALAAPTMITAVAVPAMIQCRVGDQCRVGPEDRPPSAHPTGAGRLLHPLVRGGRAGGWANPLQGCASANRSPQIDFTGCAPRPRRAMPASYRAHRATACQRRRSRAF
jgi:hypothetical protein